MEYPASAFPTNSRSNALCRTANIDRIIFFQSLVRQASCSNDTAIGNATPFDNQRTQSDPNIIPNRNFLIWIQIIPLSIRNVMQIRVHDGCIPGTQDILPDTNEFLAHDPATGSDLKSIPKMETPTFDHGDSRPMTQKCAAIHNPFSLDLKNSWNMSTDDTNAMVTDLNHIRSIERNFCRSLQTLNLHAVCNEKWKSPGLLHWQQGKVHPQCFPEAGPIQLFKGHAPTALPNRLKTSSLSSCAKGSFSRSKIPI